MQRHRKKSNIQSARNSKMGASKYHTVSLRLCQRRVLQTESSTMCGQTELIRVLIVLKYGKPHDVHASGHLHSQILP